MNELFLIPGCRIEQVARAGPTTVQISTQGTQSGAACPNCRTLSQAVHSRYRRRPADLPSLGSARLGIQVNGQLIWSSLRRNFGSQLADLRRVFTLPLVLSARTRPRAKRRTTAMFLAPWPVR